MEVVEREPTVIQQNEIQQLVDSLAARIHLSVAVDDARGSLIASSRHFGDEDKIRIDVVLSRRLPDRAAEYLNSFGIATAEDPLSVPASPALGLKARRCYPIRDHGRLLGYLWLIDNRADRFDEVVGECVAHLSPLLRERAHQMTEEEKQRRVLVAAVLRGGESSARAARELVDHQIVTAEDDIVVIVTDTTAEPEAVTAAIRESTGPLAADGPPFRALSTTVENRGVILVAGRDDVERTATWLAETARRGPRSQQAAPGKRSTVVGVSNAGRLDQAPELFRQALLATFAAAELPELPPVVSWRDTGIYGPLMLAAVESPELAVPPEIAHLKSEGRTDSLARTAEVFLDAAGDTSAASEQLMIHRTTLYYRLAQVENRTGWDLKNGRHRLILHLGLKMQHLLDSGIPALLRGEEEPRRSS